MTAELSPPERAALVERIAALAAERIATAIVSDLRSPEARLPRHDGWCSFEAHVAYLVAERVANAKRAP